MKCVFTQEISIQRSLNDVKTLRDQKNYHAKISFMQQQYNTSSNNHN